MSNEVYYIEDGSVYVELTKGWGILFDLYLWSGWLENYNWHTVEFTNKVSASTTVNYQNLLAPRLVMGASYGESVKYITKPSNKIIDCRRKNLKLTPKNLKLEKEYTSIYLQCPVPV